VVVVEAKVVAQAVQAVVVQVPQQVMQLRLL
jgi:hypothetical protein